jgi:hypothetical protein
LLQSFIQVAYFLMSWDFLRYQHESPLMRVP